MREKIPKQLQKDEFRFILIKPKSKQPVEPKWQETNNYKYNDEKLIQHLNNEGNYGTLTGRGNLRILDIDDKNLKEEFLKKINTFTVETGGNGLHFYILSDYNVNHILKNGAGELRCNNYQCVGPNSVHPNNKEYKILRDTDIVTLNVIELLNILENFIDKEGKIDNNVFEDINTQIEADKEYIDENILPKLGDFTRKLIITKLDETALKQMRFPSRSERDSKVITSLLLSGYGNYIKSIFKIYPVGDKYLEHMDGDKYLLHSIKSGRKYSGVIDDTMIVLEKELENLNERVLRNKIDEYLGKISKFDSEIMQSYFMGIIAMRIKISKRDLNKRIKELKNINEEKNPVSIKDLMSKNLPEIKYYMYPLIPKNSLILFGGKPGTFKSMLILSIALSLKDDKPFLEHFTIREHPKILLYDLENGENTVWWRLKYLLKGLNIDHDKLEDFNIETKFNKNNILKELELSKNYDVIILDSYRRFLEGTENDSEITDKFFKEFLNVLKEMGKTIIIIHHFKKAKIFEELTDEDIMDMFRGSSDIPAQFDIILGVFRGTEIVKYNTNNINFDVYVTRGKNRLGLPIRNFCFNVTKNDVTQSTEFKFNGFRKMLSPKQRIKERVIDIVRNETEVSRIRLVDLITGEFSCSTKTADNYLKELVKDKELMQPKHGVYSISIEESSDEKQTKIE